MDAIRTQDLTRTFAGATAVDRLTLSVAPGELFGLVGPDGAGKTTLLRLLASVLDPTGGDAWVCGLHTVREAEAIKESIGYMSQRFGLYPDLTVLENLRFYADIYGVTARERGPAVERLLAFSGLAPFTRRLAGNLSGGMKQKLGLACALIHTPRVLLLDEPTNGVDPVSRRDFWRILHQLVEEGVAIIVSTAYLDEAGRCGRLALVHQGRLLALGTPAEVRGIMTESILELRVDDPRRAAGVLRTALPDAQVGLFGDRIHIAARDIDAIRQRAGAALREADVPVRSAGPVAPSLEDVFISALGGAEGRDAHDGP